ncbi:MAG: ribonuclease Z [Ignisphaera sp.]|uniref:Ribonuclease Z n=1 Tax=Ignisphaera aggregans TaxID=334771 RepID=A0A7C4H246_9CREN
MVRVIFLGVGGWISEPFLGYTSLIIESRDKRILIEAGEGVYRYLRQCGYDVTDIDLITITHKHGDHVLGIPTLILMALHKGRKEIEIISIYDVIETLKILLNSIGMEHLTDYVRFTEIRPGDSVHRYQFVLNFIEALHTVQAVSIKVDVDGKCIAFSGDTIYNPLLIDFVKNCDVLIHEVSNYSDVARNYGHSSYRDAIYLASKADIKIFVPIHFYRLPLPIDLSLFENIKEMQIFVPSPCTVLEL